MIESLASVTLTDLPGLDSADTLVLTVNNRYARRIVADLSARLNETQRVMALPDIMPLSAWLRQAGDSLSFHPEAFTASHTIDAFGAQILWQRVIVEIESDQALLDTAQAARLAMEADRLVSEWRLVVGPEIETSDYQHFRRWREHYRAALSALDAEDSNLSIERVADAVMKAELDLPFGTVVLAGFNELAPRFAAMIESMRRQGVHVLVLRAEQPPAAQVQRVLAPDPDSEWRLAAQWAAGQLRQNPRGRYAIVASRLETDVVLAHRTLREALGTDGDALAYNVAVARPLADWPLVWAALAWLQVLSEFSQRKSSTPPVAGAALLGGSCVAHFSESSQRAAIDALWRKRAVVTLPLAEFAERLGQRTPELAQAWQKCLADCADQDGPATIDVWAMRFRRYLQRLGFPGRATLDSPSYQVLEAFDAVLDRLGGQASVLGRLEFAAAVGLLKRLARETLFQPQRDPAARLDVLGLLESEGGRWDGVWVLGLTDEVLPAAPKPNPLVPLAALRLAQAPRATPERELQWARSMVDALLCCAPDIRFSHAQYEGERELRPSPFIADLPVFPLGPAQPAQAVRRLERLLDEQGPALRAGATTRGGIGVIDTQSRNPLWAFVKYRLGASEMRDYADVADQNVRGVFLHRAIEMVWRMAGNQATLQNMHDDGRLSELIRQSVAHAADECLTDYGRVVKALEAARAVDVLDEWLLRELARRSFAVRDLEKSFSWTCGPLELTVRLDRIDELDDGRLAVIDYKSGIGKIDPEADWSRARPICLQLPFYAAVLAGEQSRVAALVLARLHAKNSEIKGLAEADYGFEGLALLSDWPAFFGMSWPGLMAQWRQTIERLAQEYSAGAAGNQSLRADDLTYCDVLPFLRLNEEAERVD